MALSKDQAQFYQQTLEMTRKQIGDLNGQIEEELAKVKERLAELQNAKNAAKQIYDGACKILGVENDLEKEEEAGSEPERRHPASTGEPSGGLVPPRKTRNANCPPSGEQESRVPEGLWIKCGACKEIIYRKEVVKNLARLPEVRASTSASPPASGWPCSSTGRGRSSTTAW